ncbi:MAG: hypothetical protein Q7T18_03755 [Sedimentisphaerales bacterium]|nr:hypothetical protein [Sedimentisphaerales bacterium]
MEQNRCLGIYWTRSGATAVLATFEGQTLQLWNCFTVTANQTEGQEPQSLAQRISAACAERQLVFTETAVAIECGMFSQHAVHSDFATAKQISQTIRFDAEEALATDAAKLAIAFNVMTSDESGSEVCVYSADRTAMMDILADLQNNKIDPVAMEPDVSCLVRFIQYAFSPQAPTHPLYALFGRTFGYFFAAGPTQSNWPVRTFRIGQKQDRAALAAREIPITIATWASAEAVDSLRLFDSANSIDVQKAGDKAGFAAEQIHLSQVMEPVTAGMTDIPDPVDFSIACGAALGHLAKTRVDFRHDFMPFQGKRLKLEKAIKMLSISVVMMLLAVGLYFQMRLYKANSYLGSLRQHTQKEYVAVFGKPPAGEKNLLGALKREQIRVQKLKSGQINASGEASVLALLTHVLGANNSAPPQVQLNIDYITVGSKSIMIAGDTASRDNTIALFGAIDAHPNLKTSQPSYDFKSGRDKFTVTILPRESGRK